MTLGLGCEESATTVTVTSSQPTGTASTARPSGSTTTPASSATSASSAAPPGHTWVEGDAEVKKLGALEADPKGADTYELLVLGLTYCGMPPYADEAGAPKSGSPWGTGARAAKVDASVSVRPCTPATHAALFVKLGEVHLAKKNDAAAKAAMLVAAALEPTALAKAGPEAAAIVKDAKAAKPPKISLTDVSPPARATETRAIVEKHVAALRGCYAVGLALDPKLEGRASITVELDAKGDVTEAQSIAKLFSSWVERCARTTLSRLSFPPPGSEPPTASLTINFLLPSSDEP